MSTRPRPPRRPAPEPGQRFGAWTFLGMVEGERARTLALCRCSCGSERRFVVSNLTHGSHSYSCGCQPEGELRPPRARGAIESAPRPEPSLTAEEAEQRVEFAWEELRSLCRIGTAASRQRRLVVTGIHMSPVWAESLEAFRKDVGLPTSPLDRLVRKDLLLPFEPGNAAWSRTASGVLPPVGGVLSN